VSELAYDLVIPTIGRDSLWTLLRALRWMPPPAPASIVIVDDRPASEGPVWVFPDDLGELAERVHVLRSGGRGPAAARNVGWRAGRAPWVAFVDDDVVPTGSWTAALARDLTRLGPRVAASQGQITVPLPRERPATDRERTVARIAGAPWITADMAVRRDVLERLDGLDERFPRAYREDSDLALRIMDAGFELVFGARRSVHLTAPASGWISVPQQAGNADDALMRRLHGRRWRARIGAARGRFPVHVATVAAAAIAIGCAATGPRRIAAAAALLWTGSTAQFFAARAWRGPRDARTLATMLATSAAIPFAAVYHRCAGAWRWRDVRPATERRADEPARWASEPLPAAVLLDRDGTLVVDVPFNADPARVRPTPGAREALARLRAAGIPTAVVTNQAGLADGRTTPEGFEAVNRRIEEVLGPLGPWCVCAHDPRDGCGCRKPEPGLIRQAAAALGVPASACVVIGDTEADLAAAQAAGARAILVPNTRTRPVEVARAPHVAATIAEAVDLVLGGAVAARDEVPA
jgi:histidinol-phosphate phosphatase family protein